MSGAREIRVGIPAVDHFPAFEPDGFTKRSGLSAFTVSVFRDGAVDPLSVTIVEISSTGEYSVNFTPNAIGYWVVQVQIDFNGDIWEGSYQVVNQLTNQTVINTQASADKIDSVATLSPATATSGSLIDRLCNKDLNKNYNPGTDSLEAIRDLISPG